MVLIVATCICRLRIAYPFAVPDKIFGLTLPSILSTAALTAPSLNLPQAALRLVTMVGMTVDLAVAVEESLK